MLYKYTKKIIFSISIVSLLCVNTYAASEYTQKTPSKPFTHLDVILKAPCPFTSGPNPGCSVQETKTVTQNGTYRLKATSKTNRTQTYDIVVDYIDKTRPVYLNASTYSPSTCTGGTVTHKARFLDNTNTTIDSGNRKDDRISGFDSPTNIPVGDKNGYDDRRQGKAIEYNFTANGTQSVSISDKASNQSIPKSISVNWIDKNPATATGFYIVSGITGKIPFGFTIEDTDLSDTSLHESCKTNLEYIYTITLTDKAHPSNQHIFTGAMTHTGLVTGIMDISRPGDYTIDLKLQDTVKNTHTYPDTPTVYSPTGSVISPSTESSSSSTYSIVIGSTSRVKIIGNTSTSTSGQTAYSIGERIDTNIFNTRLNSIRKNIALLTRNIGSEYSNHLFNTTKILTDKLFFINNLSENKRLEYSDIQDKISDIRSLIIVGGDLYIDTNFTDSTTDANTPKGIIVLKNNNGKGGNIYIGSGVTRIDAAIFAEGTMYSGESESNLYNDSDEEITRLPSKQLYIFGSLLSRNTILGSLTPVCPYEGYCTAQEAYKYDFDLFRSFDKSDTNRAYKDNTLDNYSMIIEHDPRILRNPPPGM